MKNEELYRKYRPANLDEMIGMETEIKSLRKEIENGSHVFLLCGDSGCGKTTIARIMAREVGAVDSSICEINSSNNRGIDTAREIMEQMKYTPVGADSSVWILDECHSWQTVVQNCFLKALEDTPSHVYFFLCTTNPEKLAVALKNRCSIINVHPLDEEETVYLLKTVAKKEERKIPNVVCRRIYDISEGCSRKSLKLLQKVLWLDSTDEMMEVLESECNECESEDIKGLCKAMINGAKLGELISIVKSMQITEPEKTRLAILGYMNGVLLNGNTSINVIGAIQAFGANNCFDNGKYQITIAILDYIDFISQ